MNERPVLAVGAVVTVDGHLLLVERARPPGVGLWTVPGGRVEPRETLQESVEREVLEETGLVVSCGPLIGWVQRMGTDYNFVIMDFKAIVGEGFTADERGLPVLRAGDDAARARWVAQQAVPSVDLVPGLLEFLTEHDVMSG